MCPARLTRSPVFTRWNRAMKTVFLQDLPAFLQALAQQMTVYIPVQTGDHTAFQQLTKDNSSRMVFNPIRTYTSIKEFVLPLRETAAVYPRPTKSPRIDPFAVLGVKACDLSALEILDEVFIEADVEDPLYVARRQAMVILSSDCFDPTDPCFCNAMGGVPYATEGFDLNFSQVPGGFVVEIGSEKGDSLVSTSRSLFSELSPDALEQRQAIRAQTVASLQHQNQSLQCNGSWQPVVESGYDHPIFDEQAQTCVECQACTRVCPTCHCFFLVDRPQADTFQKSKMWDSCLRRTYAQVAGGANPRQVLGDRLRHRFMHKFAYFVDRYGRNMCVGCGRCVEAEAGGVDMRVILRKLHESFQHQAAV